MSKLKKTQRIFFSPSSRPPLPSPSDTITTLCNQTRYTEALLAFSSLPPATATHLRPAAYAALLAACSRLHSLRHARLVHRHLSSSPSHPNLILHNHLLNTYGICRSPADARRLFLTMPHRNLVSWASIISCLTHNHEHREAVLVYKDLLNDGLVPDEFALGSTVRACSGLLDLELGRQLHCHVVKFDLGSGRVLQNALVTMYSRSGNVADASVVFGRNAHKDLVSWGSMISGFEQQGCEMDALLLFKEMVGRSGFRPNEFHFGSAFKACGSVMEVGYAEQMHGLCVKVGLDGNAFAGCSMSDMYARCGMLDCAKRAFYQIHMPDVASWNSIIGTLANGGGVNEAMVLFSRMRVLGLRPDDITVRCLLCACVTTSSLYQGQLIHSYIVKVGLCMNVTVCNCLLSMYSNCSGLLTAMYLFEEMKNIRDLVSWNTVLTECSQHQHLEEIFRLFRMMICSSNSEPDQITLNTTLNACANLADQELVNQVHTYALKVGFEGDLMVRNGLIDAYTKCGCLDDARKMFQLMGDNCDVFSWSSLIVGYAQFGCAKESLELFNQMQNMGIRPNHVTFVGVLTACSHVGLVDEGCLYYNMMEAEYGITPTREHCSCVVDMLARAGRLDDAERFIHEMAFEPDVVIWKSLLAACKVHKNTEIGKRAAESILKIDPSSSAAYTLLCNIYASSGRWDDAARTRKLMKSNAVRKSPGTSSIKVERVVNDFSVDDWSHPEAEAIYTMLELLGLEMMEPSTQPKH